MKYVCIITGLLIALIYARVRNIAPPIGSD